MAFIPDEAVLRSREIPPPAFQLYAYYCKKRDRSAGGYAAPNSLAEEELKMDRCQVNRMRRALIEAGWIAIEGDFIRPIMGDFSPVDAPKSETERPRNRDGASQALRRSVPEPRPTVSPPETERLGSETERPRSRDGASQHIRKPAHDQPMTSPERESARATLAGGLSGQLAGPNDDFAPLLTLTPIQNALRLAKGWGESLTPDQYRQLQSVGGSLMRNYPETATPANIARATDYYRAQGKMSWGLKFLLDDWPQIVAWKPGATAEKTRATERQQATEAARRKLFGEGGGNDRKRF